MNRRGFLKLFSGAAIVAAIVPSAIIVSTILPKNVEAAPVEQPVILPYTGDLRYDAGYFYCPYIPLQY